MLSDTSMLLSSRIRIALLDIDLRTQQHRIKALRAKGRYYQPFLTDALAEADRILDRRLTYSADLSLPPKQHPEEVGETTFLSKE